MFRVTDLKTVSVATPDLEGTVATFRKNFAFPIQQTGVEARDPKTRRVSLGIGPAEIEITTPSAQDSPLGSFLVDRGAGLYELVLEVDDLQAARAALVDRGVEVTLTTGVDGKPSAGLDPKRTHGVRITLIER